MLLVQDETQVSDAMETHYVLENVTFSINRAATSKMEVGKEISHKIRDAIKAKLVDLGAYVDEELPDYIMVMIANKKTTDQMKGDLQLFLSNNTEKFTVWLDAVLHKLQSATVEDSLTTSPVEETTPPPEEPQAPQPTPQPTKKSRKGRDSKSSKSSKRKVKEPVPKEPMEDVSSATLQEPDPPVVEEEPVRSEDPSQAIITLTAETGDFDEELNPEPEIAVPSLEKLEKPSETTPAQETQISEVAPLMRSPGSQPVFEGRPPVVAELIVKASEESRVSDDPDEITVTHISTSPMSVIGERGMFARTVEKAPTTYTATRKTEIQSRLGVRGQRSEVHRGRDAPRKYVLGSVVGQVIDDDEEDDIALPVTKQGLTSVVKPKRRPTLPPSKQANKSLLVRAMSDAQRSTSTELEKQRSNAIKIVRPTVKRKTVPLNLISRAITQATMSEIQTRIQKNPRAVPERDQLLAKGPVSKSKSSEEVEQDLDSNEYLSLEEDFDEIVCEEQDDIVPTVRHIDVERELVQEHVQDKRIMKICYADERVVKTTAKVSPVHVIKEPKIVPVPVAPPPKPVNNPRFIVTLAGADGMHISQQKRPPKRARVRAQKPVIRTICDQSVDSTVPPYKATNKDILTMINQPVEEEIIYSFESQVVQQGDIRGFSTRGEQEVFVTRVESDIPVAALPAKRTPKVDQVLFSLHDSEDEDMEEVSPSKKQKLLERCLFWPACKNGDTCTYVHPTTKCVTFPKCKFGDKCLYIHPNCKFDAKCSRSDCPYTHATRKQPPVSPPVQQPPAKLVRPPPVICKFHPGCKNPSCTFQHPKPCRFAGACTRADCVFSHPKVVTGSALKWTKNVQKSSSLLSSIPQHIAL